jgi:plasmid stabilization system protein ParE
MVRKIIWTPEAEKSLQGILIYLQEYWGKREVQKFIERVVIVSNHIKQHPLAYRSAGRKDIREALVTKHNLLLYRVRGETIYVLYFWDTRKNPSKKSIAYT